MKTFHVMSDTDNETRRPLPAFDIPWDMIALYEHQAQRNHGQSLSRLNERGGCSPCEILAILDERPWKRINLIEAYDELKRRHAAWLDVHARPTTLFTQEIVERAVLSNEAAEEFVKVSTRHVLTDSTYGDSLVIYIHPNKRVLVHSIISAP